MSDSARSLLPLPLAPFERFMLADDRPAFPMAFLIEAHFTGRLDRERLQRALTRALAEHPLLAARVDRSAGNGPQWIAAPASATPVAWDEAAADAPLPLAAGEAIDLTSDTGLRVWARLGRGTSRLSLQFHHACCDGVGGLGFLGDLLAHYAALDERQIESDTATEIESTSEPPPETTHWLLRRALVAAAPPAAMVDRAQSAAAGNATLSTSTPTSTATHAPAAGAVHDASPPASMSTGMSTGMPVGANGEAKPATAGTLAALRNVGREAAKVLLRWPVPLAAPRPSARSDCRLAPFPGLSTVTLDAGDYQALRQAARRHRATLNDVLVRDLFLTLAAWNRQFAPRRPGRWLRILIPTNLRPGADTLRPAANVMGYAFLTRRLAESCRGATFLAEIAAETEAIRRWRLGRTFLAAIAAADRLPGALPLALSGRRCFATAVLTNLSDPTRCFATPLPREADRLRVGDLRLERFTGAPPLRPATRAGFSINEYGGELTVCLRCDPYCFAPDDSQQLLARYADVLRETAAAARRGDEV